MRTFQSNASAMRWIFARLMSVKVDEQKSADGEKKVEATTRKLEISDQDLVSFDLEGVSTSRLRGELAREVLELFIDVMEVAAKQPNLTYLLFGFDLNSYQMTKSISIGKIHSKTLLFVLEISKEEFTCLQSLDVLIELLCSEKEPYNLPYSALFEPALRLFVKLHVQKLIFF